MNEPEHFADMLDDCPKCPRQSNPITTEGGLWPASIRETLGCASVMLLPMPDGSFVLSGSQDLSSAPLDYTQREVQLVWDMTVPAPTYFPPGVNRGLWALYNSIGILLAHYMDGHDDAPEPRPVVGDGFPKTEWWWVIRSDIPSLYRLAKKPWPTWPLLFPRVARWYLSSAGHKDLAVSTEASSMLYEVFSPATGSGLSFTAWGSWIPVSTAP